MHRPLRSFVRRAGRMTPGQKDSLAQFHPIWGLDHLKGPINCTKIFANDAPVILEIGFGMGQSLVEQAMNNPDTNFIGIEVHTAGVGKVFSEIDRLELTNLRVFMQDAVDVMKNHIIDESLDGIQVFFPDPWPKKAHHKRRLIQTAFVKLLSTKLKKGGQLHLATDWQDYAEHMMLVLNPIETLVNKAGQDAYASDVKRPDTKYENRGKRLGHSIFDICFNKI